MNVILVEQVKKSRTKQDLIAMSEVPINIGAKTCPIFIKKVVN